MARKYSSTAVETTLSSSISSAATSIVVGSVTGWPTSPSVSAPYTIIIDPDTASEEVCEVTNAAGTTLTIVRGVDSTTAKAHNTGAVVKHGVSARDFADPANHIDNTTTAHGVSGAVVGTTSTQTLSNKTIDAASNTITGIANANVAAGAAIAASKIAGTAVTQADTGTVTSTMILNGTIATADLADSAVTSAKIADLTIATGDIADSAITSAKIADLTIVDGDISASAAIAPSKISGTAAVLTGAAFTGNVSTTGTLSATSTMSASGLAGSLLSSATPLMEGTGSAGTSAIPSRQDHRHPTPVQFWRSSASLANSSTTTFQVPTGFPATVSLTAGSTYIIRVVILWAVTATGYSITHRAVFPALTAGTMAITSSTDSTTPHFLHSNALASPNQASTPTNPLSTNTQQSILEYMLVPSSTGNFNYEFAVSATGTVTVRGGSYMTVTQVA